MALVFGGLPLFFVLIILLLKRAYNTSYQENLLRKMADMAFEEKFTDLNAEDPHKKAETIYYIANYGYGYLIEDYLEVLEDR